MSVRRHIHRVDRFESIKPYEHPLMLQTPLLARCWLRTLLLVALASRGLSSKSSVSKKEVFRISGVCERELIVQKSRFIAIAAPCSSLDQAMHLLKTLEDRKASHNCWAFCSSDGYEKCSDDGEPAGTAGRPMLSAIHTESVVDAFVLVIRHFGGIKLGTGGLARAYGQATRDVLRAADRVQIVETVLCRCSVGIGDVGVLYRVAASFTARKLDETFDESNVTVTLELPAEEAGRFEDELGQKTKGTSIVEKLPNST